MREKSDRPKLQLHHGPIEIERKFLVANDDWRQSAVRSVSIRDGLIAAYQGRKVRVRISGNTATVAIKGPRTGIVRPEFEYKSRSPTPRGCFRPSVETTLWRKAAHQTIIVRRDEQNRPRRDAVDDPFRIEAERVVDEFERQLCHGRRIVAPRCRTQFGRLPVGQQDLVPVC